MSTSFTILVSDSATQSQPHLSALRFITAALAQGHQITNVFFYQEAVYVANRFLCTPEDELQLTDAWVALSQQNQFELQVCVAASNRRGVVSDDEAATHGLEENSLHPSFSVLGLGQLAAVMSNQSNRMVHFK